MSIETEAKPNNHNQESRTRVVFDLRSELSDDEIRQFEKSAATAGAASLTEHFLNITIRKPENAKHA